jgi:hypothetical protein
MNKKFAGLMIGILVSEEGEPFIGMDLNGSRVVFSVEQAGLVFETLSRYLESVGYFDDEEEGEKRVLN